MISNSQKKELIRIAKEIRDIFPNILSLNFDGNIISVEVVENAEYSKELDACVYEAVKCDLQFDTNSF